MKHLLLLSAAMLIFSFTNVQAQEAEEQEQELSFWSGTWSYEYLIGQERVSYGQFMQKMQQNEQAFSMFKSGKNMVIAGNIIGSVSAFCFGWDLGTRLGGGKGNTGLLVGSGVVTAGSLLMAFSGERKMKKAVTLYNNSIKDKSSYNIQLGISPDRLSLCIVF